MSYIAEDENEKGVLVKARIIFFPFIYSHIFIYLESTLIGKKFQLDYCILVWFSLDIDQV